MDVQGHPALTTAEVFANAQSTTDVTVLKGLEATLRRRDAVLAAVCYAASRFLAPSDFDRDVRELIARLGVAAEVSRAYLYEGYRDPQGAMRRRMRNEWAAAGLMPRECDDASRDVEVEKIGLTRWRLLERGDVVHGPSSELPAQEREFFARMGVRSFAAVPVFVGSKWWGYLGLADSSAEREWSPNVLEALQAASATLGAALYRKKAEEQVRQSEERFRRLTDAAFEGVLVHDNGVMLEANPAISRIFGYEHDDLIGRNLIEVIPSPESRALVLEHIRTGSEARYEITGQRKDGTPFIAEITSRPTSHKGKPARVATVHDITERKKAEEQLRKRGKQLAHAQAIAQLGSWDWDIETNELTGSDEMYRIYGFEPNAPLTTGAILARIHPDDADLLRAAIDGAVVHGRDFSVDHRVVRPAGDIRHVRSLGRVVKDATGKPTMIIGAGHDVTDQKHAEAVSRQLIEERAARAAAEGAERRAAVLADASRLLGTSFDYQTTLSRLARLAVPAIADYCTVDLVGRDGEIERVAVAHVDAAKESLLWEVRRWVRAGAPMSPHLQRALVDGEPMLIPVLTDEMTARAALDEDHAQLLSQLHAHSFVSVPLKVSGKPIGVLVLYSSESERHFDEDDLALAEELARRAALAVDNARLYHEAQLATRARDQMLGIVAHDLRNPLNTILMASELLEEVLVSDVQKSRQVQMVRRAGKQMNHLIQDLLDVKRIENGRLAVEPRAVRAIALLNEAVEMLRSLASARGLDLALEETDELPMVKADAQRIHQVFSNLIGNAIKFTPRGGKISLSGKQRGADVYMGVSDTGQGIPAEQLPHVFGQFWQASGSDRRGIGLGLAIAKGIVEAHEGRIWVESAIGEGSSFYFTLPVQN
ncbi:MAG: Circadian input kinase [Gemmatimonadetes bacterium]|nr:Circadian input kinase [Gemmatimonadota bacterium]